MILYYQAWQENTYSFPPERPLQQHVRGGDSDRTALAKNWIREHPAESSPADLEANLPYEQIWNPESILRANRRLLLTYGWVVLSLTTAVFCLVEANASSSKTARSPEMRGSAGQIRGNQRWESGFNTGLFWQNRASLWVDFLESVFAVARS